MCGGKKKKTDRFNLTLGLFLPSDFHISVFFVLMSQGREIILNGLGVTNKNLKGFLTFPNSIQKHTT